MAVSLSMHVLIDITSNIVVGSFYQGLFAKQLLGPLYRSYRMFRTKQNFIRYISLPGFGWWKWPFVSTSYSCFTYLTYLTILGNVVIFTACLSSAFETEVVVG